MVDVYIDGASLGNPGDAGIGVVVYKNSECVYQRGFYIGKQTNNFAEYAAMLFGICELLAQKQHSATIFTDSELVANHLKGTYKVKSDNLKFLHTLCKKLLLQCGKVDIKWIEREKNAEADSLSKQSAKYKRDVVLL